MEMERRFYKNFKRNGTIIAIGLSGARDNSGFNDAVRR